MIVVSDKLSTESFHAFIDEQLNDEQYLQVEEQLDEFPEKVEEIQQCQIINERLREVFDSIVEEDLPRDLYEVALHGVSSETTEEELALQQFGYEFDEDLNEVTGYQDEIASPLDSMNSALELQNEEFIENNEFADLEALSGQESLADFDIDALSGNNQGIIPDIFDEDDDHSAMDAGVDPSLTTSSPYDEDMLSSLESLSLEPLETETPTSESATVSETHNDTNTAIPQEVKSVSDELNIPELKLEPLEQEQSEQGQYHDGQAFASSSVAEQAESREQFEEPQVDEQAAALEARERVLESLQASEDLSLEPAESEAAAEINTGAKTDANTEENTEEHTKVIQLPADFGDDIAAAESKHSIANQDAGSTREFAENPEASERHILGATEDTQLEANSGSLELAEHELPVDTSTAFTQTEESVHQAQLNQDAYSADEVVDETSPAEEPLHLKEENPADPEYPIDEIVHELDEIPNGENVAAQGAPQDVVAEFFAGNKTEPDFEVSEVVKHFDEVSDDFASQQQESYESPVAQIKQKADNVLNVINNKFYAFKKNVLNKEDDIFPDFNQAPVFHDKDNNSSAVNNKREQPAQDSPPSFDFDFGSDSNQSSGATAGLETESQVSSPFESAPGEFDFDIGVDEEPKPGRLSKKIGDTLRSYKQQRQQEQGAEFDQIPSDDFNNTDADANTGNAMVHYEELTGLDKFKYLSQHTIDKVSPENRMTIGGVILLVIGLVIGGSTASLMGDPEGNLISAEKVERLAIDAHILYTQQDQNFAGNPSASITESMQWLSARIGRHIRLADVQPEEFKHQRAIIMPTMVSYATANIFENKNKEKVTMFIAAGSQDVSNSALTCRIPTGVDGLCSWVKDSMYYIVIGNLSLSRVRAFSQEMIDKL